MQRHTFNLSRQEALAMIDALMTVNGSVQDELLSRLAEFYWMPGSMRKIADAAYAKTYQRATIESISCPD